MKIVFATARPPRTVHRFLPGELMEIAAFVYYNGAHIVCRQLGLEFHESIPSPITAQIVDYCLRLSPDIELTMEVRDEWFSLRDTPPICM